jgi:N-methylhydantoinase B
MPTAIDYDPVLLELLWNRIVSITDEQAAALVHTAFTAVVSESEDIAAGLFDGKGRMLAQSQSGTPGHINSMANAVRHFVARYPKSGLEPGDVLITNDPWISSGHLHDVTVVTPVFQRERAIAFFASTVHVKDIGGRPLGADAPDVFEEGFCIPITHLYRAGAQNEFLFELISANVRYPTEVLGDIHAQVIGNDVGQQRLKETLREFGLDDLGDISAVIRSRSKEAVARAVESLPDGVYRHQLDVDGVDERVTLAVAVIIEGSEICVDFAGSSPQQPFGINSVPSYTGAYVVCALKCALCPEVPNNDGIISAFKISTPAGTIVNPIRPAPVAGRHVIGQVVPDLIYQALAPVLPDNVIAGGSAVDWITQVHGCYADGTPFSTYFVLAGGMGASSDRDGLGTVSFPSRPNLIPLETIESQSPLVFDYQRIRVDSGGSGQYRGGLGQEVQFRVRTDQPFLFCPMYDRIDCRPPGLAGGQPGAPGNAETMPDTHLHPKRRSTISPGTVVRLALPGGGGYGDPHLRARDAVRADVNGGYISPEVAEKVYGLVASEPPDCSTDTDSGPEPASCADRDESYSAEQEG